MSRHVINTQFLDRILTSLGHLGFSRYKRPLVRHFEIEIDENGLLHACKGSLDKFWKQTLEVNSKEYVSYIKTTTTKFTFIRQILFKDKRSTRRSHRVDFFPSFAQ